MQWKVFLTQFAILLAAVLLLTKFFAAPNATPLSNSLITAHMQAMEARIARLEKTLDGHQMVSSVSTHQEQSSEVSDLQRAIGRLNDRLARLESQRSLPVLKEPPPMDNPKLGTSSLPRVPPSPPSIGKDPAAWVQTLPEEKRAKVNDLFKYYGDILHENLSGAPGNNRTSPDAMREIIEENDRELKASLKQVLTEQEYNVFLDSLPAPIPKPPAPYPR